MTASSRASFETDCAGVTDKGGTAQTAEGFAGQKIISYALFDMTGGFLFHALGLLKIRFADDGGDAAGGADIAPDINAGVTLI